MMENRKKINFIIDSYFIKGVLPIYFKLHFKTLQKLSDNHKFDSFIEY